MGNNKKKQITELDSEIVAAASVVGKMEHEGPIGEVFDAYDESDEFGQKTWEKSESEMQKLAFGAALSKGEFTDKDIDIVFAGDLLNQCIAATYGLASFDTQYIGLYGACSTAAESMLLASVMTTHGVAERAVAITSSHNCSAEMQFRTPLEYGGQRPPTAQWTVTGSGAFVIERSHSESGAFIKDALIGKIKDFGIKDANNMGAAMAPAAADTLNRYFTESKSQPSDYDLILTGDLGYEGSRMLCDLMRGYEYDISDVHNDCGLIIYSTKEQDVHAGGSGCGCSAVVMASYIIPKLRNRELNSILFLGTGALMSPSSLKQGQSIPGIAHLLHLTSHR